MTGLAALAGSASGATALEGEQGEYLERTRPPAGLGIGKGEAASVSVVWLPRYPDQAPPSRSVELVIFDLDGSPIGTTKKDLEPFGGAVVDFVPTDGTRHMVYGYVFAEPPFDDLFGAFEVYDVSPGRTKLAVPSVVP